MKQIHFDYDMRIEYTEPVGRCNYTIKSIPKDTKRQEIKDVTFTLDPPSIYSFGEDGFHNKTIYGVNDQDHIYFHYHMAGNAITGLSDYEELEDEDQAMIFRHPHGLNIAGKYIHKFYNQLQIDKGSKLYEAEQMMGLLYDSYTYQANCTTINTSAEEAFILGKGVCQDYAHIYIALLHLHGINARYVTGLIIGEGASHAWVEILEDGKWYGLDPTNNKRVNDEYIKIGVGRDAMDCQINRGIMKGGGLHTQIITVKVLEVLG